jgi:hypothetical protein
MADPFGGFTEEALAAYQKALAEQEGTDFAEGDSYDFTTCIRPDGSAYGTRGKCRKGTEGEAKEKGREVAVKALKEQIAKTPGETERKFMIEALQGLEKKTPKSQVSLVTPQKQGKADVDRLEKYIKEEATKFDNQRQAIRDGKAKADDPEVKKNLALRQRNVNEAMKQRDQLQKEMDKAAATQSPKRPADNSPAAQQRRMAAAARAIKPESEAPAKRTLASSAESKSAWQETEKNVKAAKAEVARVKAETKGDKSPEAVKRRLAASIAQDKAERLAQKASDKYFAATKRESKAAMTPEQRREEREWEKNKKRLG